MTKFVKIEAANIANDAAMILYGHPGSGCTRKVLTILAEKGIEAPLVLIDMSRGEHKDAEHLARQPFGVIPALTIDGFTMYESRAIVRYLEDRFPAPSLTPSDRRSRAMMEQYLSVEYCNLERGISKLFRQKVINPMIGIAADETEIVRGREEVCRVFDVLEPVLATQPYLAGEMFSLAEISYLPGLDGLNWAKEESLIADRPSVGAWAQRIAARPSWQKVLGMLKW